MRGVKICDTMIAQQELQHLLTLPDQEKISLAHRLLESLVKPQPIASVPALPAVAESVADNEIHPSAQWLLSMAQEFAAQRQNNEAPEKIPFLSLAGIFSGSKSDTGERADEICQAEIKRRSGFTLKEELPE